MLSKRWSNSVRRLRWLVLVFELLLVALALAMPPVDVPQTAFNEGDTPVNEATVPVVLGCRAELPSLQTSAASAVGLSKRLLWDQTSVLASSATPQRSRCRSLLVLLCTFLC